MATSAIRHKPAKAIVGRRRIGNSINLGNGGRTLFDFLAYETRDRVARGCSVVYHTIAFLPNRRGETRVAQRQTFCGLVCAALRGHLVLARARGVSAGAHVLPVAGSHRSAGSGGGARRQLLPVLS